MSPNLKNGRNAFFLCLILLVFSQLNAFGQGGCACPALSTCGPCTGGLTTLTIRYTGGSLLGSVTARDGTGASLSGGLLTGNTITFYSDGYPTVPFGDGEVTITARSIILVIVAQTTIDTDCSSPIYQGSTYDGGDFVIMAGESVGGVPICCSPTGMENIPPATPVCPANINLMLGAAECTKIVNWTAPPVPSDNCGGVSLTSNHNPGETFGLGTTPIIYTATDEYGNTSQCSFNVTITDNLAPVINSCAPPQTGIVDAACSFLLPDYRGLASATDNCSLIWTQTPAPGTPINGLTPQTITLRATDPSANFTECTFTLALNDNIDPVITSCPSHQDVVMVAGTCSFTLPNFAALATATDNCGTINWTQDPPVGTVLTGRGTTQVITLTADDGSGNEDKCSFIITLTDEDPPVFTSFPTDVTVYTGPGDITGEAPAGWTEPLAADGCDSNPSLSSTHISGANFSVVATPHTVQYTAEDEDENSVTSSFNVIVVDDTPPRFTTVPTNIIVSTDPTATTCEAVVSWTEPVAEDNVTVTPTITRTVGAASGTAFAVGGPYTIEYRVEDAVGNFITGSFTITVLDDTDPVITSAPSDHTEDMDAGLCTFALPDYGLVSTTTDNCGTINWTQAPPMGTVISGGVGTTQLITLTADDGQGNPSAMHSFTITLADAEIPVITSAPSDHTEDMDAGLCTFALPDYALVSTGTDNCGTINWTQAPPMGTVISGGVGTTQLITLTADDGHGNLSAVHSFTITLADAEIPVITSAPSDHTENMDAGLCTFALRNYALVSTATDNCGTINWTQAPPMGTVISGGVGTTQLITLTVDDGHGNTSAVHSFTITLADAESPVITSAPSDHTEDMDAGLCTFALRNYALFSTATDNCGTINWTQVPPMGTVISGGVGTTQVITLTADDGHGNLSAVHSFTITLADVEAPTFTICPSNITIPVDATGCGANVTWTIAVTDNCTTNPTLTSNFSPGYFPVGETTVNYNARDAANNTATCSFTVTVVDDDPPVFTNCNHATVLETANSDCQAIVTWDPPTVAESCVTVTSNYKPGDTFERGPTRVTYTAIDRAGNESTCFFNIVVIDKTPPLVNGCPPDIHATANSNCQAIVSWTPPSIKDCEAVTVTSSHKPGDTFDLGTTKVTYSFTDNDGNSSSCKFNVIVEDKSAPVFTNCPTEISASANASCDAIVNWSSPIAADDCGSVKIVSTHKPGDTFPIGSTEVKYTATDRHGNFSTCKFNVVIANDATPVFEGCPSDINVRADYTGLVKVEWTAPTATAQCSEVALTNSHNPGDVFELGSTEVEYKATSDQGIITTCRFTVTVSYEDILIDIGKAITPDGDGINDRWIMTNIEKFSDNSVIVVDRWGSVVYRATGYNNENVGWDGLNSSGSVVPAGTYFYTISVRLGDRKVEKRGFVELVR